MNPIKGLSHEEFVRAWSVRRRRQAAVSLLSAGMVIALLITSASTPRVSETDPIPTWKVVFAGVTFAAILVSALFSVFNARCPNCGTRKGSAIFFRARCGVCRMS